MRDASFLNTPIEKPRCVLICGDLNFQRRVLRQADWKLAGLTFASCPGDPDNLIASVRQLNSPLVIAKQSCIEALPRSMVLQFACLRTSCKILAVLESETEESAAANDLLRLGCWGVLPQRFSRSQFRRAVLSILEGELWAPRWIVANLLFELLRATIHFQNGLTPQEVRILELMRQGRKNAEIADALFISMETVRWHKRQLNRKLRGTGPDPHPQSPETGKNWHRAVG